MAISRHFMHRIQTTSNEVGEENEEGGTSRKPSSPRASRDGFGAAVSSPTISMRSGFFRVTVGLGTSRGLRNECPTLL